ncbi:unnamed protein product, partial [Didymodactylos carnosus]
MPNLYFELSSTPRRFISLTGIPIESFNDIYPVFEGNMIRRLTTLRKRVHKSHYNVNVLLLLLIWLRQYCTYSLLSLMFGISMHQVGRLRLLCFPILVKTLKLMIKWPSANEMTNLVFYHSVLGRYIGAVDGTRHLIQRPSK